VKKFACPHLKECSGCEPQASELAEQQKIKVEEFLKLAAGIGARMDKVKVHSLSEGFLRTRLELTWNQDHWGFWSKDRNSLLHIMECHQIDPLLNEFFQKFKLIRWPMKKASVRLRMSPEKAFGVWLDLANEDVKNLFESKLELHALLKIAEVEIGQRRKQLVFEEGRFRLKDPYYQKWISTFVNKVELELFSLIGGFSQTGPLAVQKIAEILEQFLNQAESQQILEFGSGFGTLTLPAAAGGKRKVLALEVDERSTIALERSLKLHKITSVEILRGDFQKKILAPECISEIDTYLVNPPRSGVQNLLHQMPRNIKNLVYMSCFLESFLKDAEVLKAQGFEMKEAHLIDQFPQTSHTEWMSLWQRSV
jgi:23S rRNA (uracil1939-C5)-methyltransferase